MSWTVAEQVFIPLTVGGCVRTVDDVRRSSMPSRQGSINTAAVDNPHVVADAARGRQSVHRRCDRCKADRPGNGRSSPTAGATTPLDAVEWARKVAALGAGEILLTSMDRDGTKSGFDLGLTRAVADAVPIPVIASGGVGTLEHLAEGVSQGRADAVLAASIFHFGEHTVREAKELMRERGIEVRL